MLTFSIKIKGIPSTPSMPYYATNKIGRAITGRSTIYIGITGLSTSITNVIIAKLLFFNNEFYSNFSLVGENYTNKVNQDLVTGEGIEPPISHRLCHSFPIYSI